MVKFDSDRQRIDFFQKAKGQNFDLDHNQYIENNHCEIVKKMIFFLQITYICALKLQIIYCTDRLSNIIEIIKNILVVLKKKSTRKVIVEKN